MSYTGYIRPKAYTGFITVDVWDDKDNAYPVIFHRKYMDYSINEIKKDIRQKLNVKRMKWVIA